MKEEETKSITQEKTQSLVETVTTTRKEEERQKILLEAWKLYRKKGG
jgi:hypothetical protein